MRAAYVSIIYRHLSKARIEGLADHTNHFAKSIDLFRGQIGDRHPLHLERAFADERLDFRAARCQAIQSLASVRGIAGRLTRRFVSRLRKTDNVVGERTLR